MNPTRRRDALALGVGLALLVLGAVASTTPVSPVAYFGRGLPALCWFRAATGVECAGCGLTRSVVATCHGDLTAALAFHFAGPLVVLFAALQLPYRGYRLLAGRPTPRLARAGTAFLTTLASLTIAVWLLRLAL